MNLRVLALSLFGASAGFSQATLNVVPSREIGHPQLLPNDAVVTLSPNLVEGRELYNPQSLALDQSVSPPILYVSDTNNNRVLAWKNATSFTNGKPADFVVGQQDFFSTLAGGPATPFSARLSAPTGLAVFGGDLYIADSGNNRVLRFRKPASTPPDQLFPDLIIGQPNLSGNKANYPGGQTNEKGIALANGNTVLQASMAFDKPGNLWFTDAGNRRVLMYPASEIAKSNNFGIAATIVLGQTDFLSAQALNPNDPLSATRTNLVSIPAGLAFDTAGRLYVSDGDGANPPDALNRVLVFLPPFSSGQSAARIMGILTPPPQGTVIDPRTLLSQQLQVRMNSPTSIFFLPGNQGMGVVDSGWSRILIFDPFDQWPDPNTATSPSAKAVVGQGGVYVKADGTSATAQNNGNPKSSEQTFFFPSAAVFFNNELYVADSGNNRVIVMPLQGATFGSATRLLGQDRFDSNSINLIEGREFQFGARGSYDAGLAIDSTGDIPHLYVADTYNNRVLGFKDLRNLKPGAAADIVIGQPDMATALCNPTNDSTAPTQSSLCRPTGLLVDSFGNLYVADSLNGRVLRFPTPFAHQGQQQADLVLGQHDYFNKITDPTSRTMFNPYGLAFAGNNGLLVSDVADNRVLFFKFTGNGTFTAGADNGIAATKVFGQPDFSTITRGSSDTQMNAPHHLSTDSDARIYVADTANNRVLIFDQINNNPNAGAHAALIVPNLSNVEGLFVNQLTGEAWITNTGNSTVLKFPKFDALQNNISATAQVNTPFLALAVVQDQFGNLIVADGTNRVAFYYPTLSAVNGANLMPARALAPGVIATIFAAAGGNFGKSTASYTDLPSPIPWPKTLADTQVLFNGTPAPLIFVGPTQINFMVPMNAPTGGNAEIQVLKVSTGQLLAISNVIAMNTVSPGIFEITGSGPTRTAAVLNQNNSINSATNPAKRGETISIYATGQGSIPGAPADGDVPRNGLVNTPFTPRVFLGADYTDNIPLQPNDPQDHKFVTFSGLSPNLPGVWQINVIIPFGVFTGQQTLFVSVNSVASIDVTVTQYRTVIYVAQ